LIFNVVAAAVIATASPAPASTTMPVVTWNTITLGAPAAQLRTAWGDPLAIAKDDRGVILARYALPGTRASYVFVVDRGGQIGGFAAFHEPEDATEGIPADPSTVAVGDSFESAKGKHPDFQLKQDDTDSQTFEGNVGDVHVAYRVVKDRIAAISWLRLSGLPAQTLPDIANPAGDAFASAILDVQPNESSGTAWEYRYIAFHPCAENSAWKPAKQSLVQKAGRAYDILHVVCPASNAERDFYFDITPYFGKL
jgi:hypothetical protein